MKKIGAIFGVIYGFIWLATIPFGISAVYADTSGVSPGIPEPSKTNAIAQLFNWKFRDISTAIPRLKELGYSHIHVSPPQKSPESLSVWWGRYQPVSFREISGPLGNESEFLKMNQIADQNEISVIVDVVINHMAGGNYKQLDTNGNMISENYPEFSPADFHPYHKIDWNNTESIEKGWLYGDLPDLDTSSNYVRNELSRYLKKLLDLKVDGFRIDAAVHISPEDLKEIINFIPKNILIVFEISRESPSDMMRFSKAIPWADYYDFPLLNTMRLAFGWDGDLSILENPENAGIALAGQNAITFVSNHDIDRGWAVPGEGMDDPKWRIAKEDRELAYAYIFGREAGLPYVFVDMKNPKPDIDVFPDESLDRPSIIAGLRFHNLALGKNESWVKKEKTCVAWQRGNDMLVIINKSTSICNLDQLHTSLIPGRYKEVRHGYYMDVEDDGTVNEWGVSPRSAFYFVRTNKR